MAGKMAGVYWMYYFLVTTGVAAFAEEQPCK